jgi:phosphoribosylformimino-5-aminoimidazole carboxamide ribotide isomerase
MLLIPVIEIKERKCTPATVVPGRENGVPSDNPVEVAQHWAAAGARRLHVVDMDGSLTGKPANAAMIREIVDACPGIPLQVSGGTHSDANVENYFDVGAEFVILGTKTASKPHFINNLCLEYPGHILVELDTKDGKVHAEGWSKLAEHDVREVAEHFQREGVAGILYSDKYAVGMRDLNIEVALSLAQAVTIPVIMADGLSSLEDIRQLCEAGGGSLAGAVVSAQKLDFAKAQKLADALGGQSSDK